MSGFRERAEAACDVWIHAQEGPTIASLTVWLAGARFALEHLSRMANDDNHRGAIWDVELDRMLADLQPQPEERKP